MPRDEFALTAIRALDAAVHDAASEPVTVSQPLLHLHVRLRAVADELVQKAELDGQRAAVRLACTTFLSLVVRPAASRSSGGASTSAAATDLTVDSNGISVANELDAMRRRSERYQGFASRSTSLITSHALRQLRELLSAAPPPSAAYNDRIVGAWLEWRSSRSSDEQAEGSVSRRSFGKTAGRWGGVTSGGLGCVLTFGYSPHVTRLLATAAATEHFTVRATMSLLGCVPLFCSTVAQTRLQGRLRGERSCRRLCLGRRRVHARCKRPKLSTPKLAPAADTARGRLHRC